MKRAFSIAVIFLLGTLAFVRETTAQEHLGPVRFNPLVKNEIRKQLGNGGIERNHAKTTVALPLPFFEDFTGYSYLPDTNKWTDNEAYINNTMCASPISRGVATLDDLTKYGLPYDTLSNTDFTYADSLTSQPINLDIATVTPADSVYFSFFYQAQGKGSYPLPQDSLMLYAKNRFGNFVKIWAIPGPALGTPLQPFQQVMLPITDSLYFHGTFQFRFVNIASAYWADAVWNIDYIKLDKNRSAGDTTIGDMAMTSDPGSLLNDYTFMPYSQFMANTIGELAHNITDSAQNDTSCLQNISYSFQVLDTTGGASTILCPTTSGSSVFLGYQAQQLSAPFSITTYPTYPANATVSFEVKSYFQSTGSTGNKTNDTVAKQQIFDNYVAYDDGTAERAYYLTLNPSGAIPGEVQVEYHLNHPDTLRGMAIYFARQIPLADYKEFFIRVYSTLINVNGYSFDNLLTEQQFLFPGYIDTVNHFWVYKLDTPLVLPAGTFYAGTVQPAYSGSDSLYLGFDANRIGGNHGYYRVEGFGTPWASSTFNGAIMMRPILGHDITSSAVKETTLKHLPAHLLPNPATKQIQLFFSNDGAAAYQILDMQGNIVLKGITTSGKEIDIEPLLPGTYFAQLIGKTGENLPLKFIKL